MDIEHNSKEILVAKELSSTDYDQAYSNLIAIEKYARNEALLEITWNQKTIEKLIDVFHFILTRRAQQKTSIIVAVKQCIGYINTLKERNDFSNYEALCKVVCSETEGKVFVDVERARLVRDFALYLEEKNRLEDATQLMLTMHIETFTSLDRKERMDFLLVQLRLALECKDYLRSMLLSNKVNRTTLQSEGFEALRLEFCRLMVKYYTNEGNYLENCRMCFIAYETLSSLNEEKRLEVNSNKFLALSEFCINESVALRLSTMYLICAKYCPEKKDLMNRLKDIRLMETLPLYLDVLQRFLTDEVIDSKRLIELYGGLYQNECLIHMQIELEEIQKQLLLQVTHHNIRVIAKYYQNITISRFAQLLCITEEELEKQICVLVNAKHIYAKINRLDGVISFIKTKDPREVLGVWADDIDQLLTLVNDTCFLIETEKMVHAPSD
ncbi:26S proteasome non-ATPase regulatory subunit [Entamoeba marina]